jgi:hypothetical protein
MIVVTRVGPIRVDDHMEIIEWIEGRVIGVRHDGIVTGVGRFTLEPAGSGATMFAWEEDLTFPWYLGGRLGSSIGGPVVLKRIWRHNLAALKKLVEGRTAPAG